MGLFAGIGGLELGLERAGHRTVLLSEKDEGAQQVLRERLLKDRSRRIPIEPDVRGVRKSAPDQVPRSARHRDTDRGGVSLPGLESGGAHGRD